MSSPPSIGLPTLGRPGTSTVAAAIGARRSCRTFRAAPIPLADLAELLWSAQGVTDDTGRRATPSAGGQYPLQVFLVRGLRGDPGGLTRYEPATHSLHVLDRADRREALRVATLENDPWMQDADAVLVLAAGLDAIVEHFQHQTPEGNRGIRYAHIEAGAAAQNVSLHATSLGLGCVIVGGFDDDAVHRALRLPPELTPLLLLALGVPEPTDD